MSPELRRKLEGWLASKGQTFREIREITLDSQTGSLDLWYLNEDGLNEVDEMFDVEYLLEYLVEKPREH